MSWLAFNLVVVGAGVSVNPVETTPPVADSPDRDWLSVHTEPAMITLGSGEELAQHEIIDMLALRLAPTGIRVLARDQASDLARTLEWKVNIVAMPTMVRIELFDPNGASVASQRIVTKRRRPADLAHTIALFVAEGMAPVFERLLQLVPESEMPRIEPEGLEQTDVDVVEERQDLMAVGIQVWGAYSHPGRKWLTSLGLHYAIRLRYVMGEISWNLWSPLRADGNEYSLKVQYFTARLLVGLRYRMGPFAGAGGIGGRPARPVGEPQRNGHPGRSTGAGERWCWCKGSGCVVPFRVSRSGAGHQRRSVLPLPALHPRR